MLAPSIPQGITLSLTLENVRDDLYKIADRTPRLAMALMGCTIALTDAIGDLQLGITRHAHTTLLSASNLIRQVRAAEKVGPDDACHLEHAAATLAAAARRLPPANRRDSFRVISST